ncbi:MAG: IS5 family transposase [Magnetococcales bacterium]|nr:IS5 family transposase [Magnetococcales bacterium]
MDTTSPKHRYRIRNWREYNAALVNRGRLTLWFDEDAISQWFVQEKTGKRGASQTYTDVAIQCALTLQEVYRLPLRGTEGLLSSLIELMGLSLSCPDYTTLGRRRQKIVIQISRSKAAAPRHIVVDSSGLKVYDEGEWKVRQHGPSKRRTWRKLHLGVDESTKEIVAVMTTSNDIGDGETLPDLLDQVDDPIRQVSADGAYDTKGCHDAIRARGACAAIPPRENAVTWPDKPGEPPHPRNQILERIDLVGRKKWREESDYHRRSLAETAIFRYKTIFGDRLTARIPDAQVAESYTRCHALNKMTRLGMPDSYRVEM